MKNGMNWCLKKNVAKQGKCQATHKPKARSPGNSVAYRELWAIFGKQNVGSLLIKKRLHHMEELHAPFPMTAPV